MQTLWEDADHPRSVREIHSRVTAERDLAYTTVMTVLDRLAKKHLVNRKLEGRAWLYQSKQTHTQLVVDEVLRLLCTLSPAGQREVLREVSASLPKKGERT